MANNNNKIYEMRMSAQNTQQLKKDLNYTEQRYKAVVDTQSELICRLSTDLTIGFVNAAYCRFFKKTESQFIGRNFLDDHVPENDHQRLKRHFAAFNKDCLQRTIDQRAMGPEGNIHWIQWIDNAVLDENDIIIEFQCVGRDITDLQKITKALEVSHAELKTQKQSLEQKNIALMELMEQIGIEKERLNDNVLHNVQEIILPVLKRVRLEHGKDQERYLDLLNQNLMNLTESFGRKISSGRIKLTPKELEICNMIKNGLTSKEAAELLHVTEKTIEVHRHNIRRKLGLSNQKINLTTYLQNLD